jgi:peptide/nickel transport system permease protein
MTSITETSQPFEDIGLQPASALHGLIRIVRKNYLGAAAGLICLGLVFLALFGASIAPHSATWAEGPRLHPPSMDYPYGTDNLFRDMFSRIVIGARNSIGIGFGSVAVATLVGVTLGVSTGYLGGWWDFMNSRLIDMMIAFPPVVFLIFILTMLSPTYWTLCLSIGLVLAPGTTRVVRSATIAVRNLQFVEAAVAIGNSPLRIMVRHVLPNVLPSIIVIASVQIGTAILAEATISFLGLGVSNASNPSWGRMLQESRQYWQSAWWTAVIPGLALSIAVLAFNLFGDALRDALDPRLRGSR